MIEPGNKRLKSASEPRVATRAMAVKIAACYAVLGGVWILASGWLLHYFVYDRTLEALIETIKGWFYVLATALLLGLALDRYFRMIRYSTQLLQESEARWKQALEGASQAVWDWNVQTNEVFYSASWKVMFGFDPNEIGNTFSEWETRVHPDDVQRVLSEVRRHLAGETPAFTSEHRIRCKDGSYKWILNKGKVMLRTPEGEPLRVLGTHADITERRLAEQRIRESEERFSGIFHSSPAAIGISRLSDGIFVDVNDAFVRLYGYTREDLIGHSSDELALWQIPIRSQLISELRKKKQLHNIEIQGRRKDGGVRELLASLQLVDLVGEQCILGILIDVTELKRAEAALEESQARYRLVSENSSDVIWLYDLVENRFNYVSPSVERLRGFTVEEVMQQDIEKTLAPDSYAFIADNLPKRLAAFTAGDESQRSRTYEVFQRCKDGSVVPTEVVSTLIADERRHVTHIQGVTRDITERKRLEAQIQQGQKLEAIGQLAGGVAHDFNNILAAIMMRVNLMQMSRRDDPEIRQGLAELETEARRAADLTRQLLMFSRRSVLTVKLLDLNEVVANIMKMLKRIIGEHIDLRFKGRAALPSVEADAGMLEQVLMNLVVNARDAMPNGGLVEIRTSAVILDTDKSAVRSERRPGEFLCLAVTDTGCGMEEETLKRIFDPFFTTKEIGKGTGLGLATVHGIVAQHRGWVEVESKIGQGTTFRVFLPAAAAKAMQNSGKSRPADAAPHGNETLLVVEDDIALRRIVVQLLSRLGYRVHEAGTGQEAMAFWQTHGSAVDLILTDMVMPEGMTGLELVERLRARHTRLKAIISSGYSSDIVQAGLPMKEGIAFLPKPYEAQLLARTVRECLDQNC